MSSGYRFPVSPPMVVAHRGSHGAGSAPNSLAALGRALDLGLPCIEFDVNVLGDGGLILAHDDALDLDGVRRPLRLLSSGDVGTRTELEEGARLPDALPLLREGESLLVLDWKPVGLEARIGEVMGLVDEHGLSGRTLVSTGEVPALRAVREASDRIGIGLTISTGDPPERREGWPELLDDLRPDAVMFDGRFAYTGRLPEMVDRARARECGVFFWTARTDEEFTGLRDFGPDGIMSDAAERHRGLS
ncbi:MAG TPA: glycerophosphodiester phosphodiesterase [Candidatus Dormibacteraeota bacterium]|jgi:glycerophosphoryl diester phosphodiesterase|nr:glycerophosphodiester phosphodiesterase [Candidatus Dormibacteraeota bacterium]